jgi:hypothetical protein
MAAFKSFPARFRESYPDFPETVPTQRLLELLSEVPEVYRDLITEGLQAEETDAGSV